MYFSAMPMTTFQPTERAAADTRKTKYFSWAHKETASSLQFSSLPQVQCRKLLSHSSCMQEILLNSAAATF